MNSDELSTFKARRIANSRRHQGRERVRQRGADGSSKTLDHSRWELPGRAVNCQLMSASASSSDIAELRYHRERHDLREGWACKDLVHVHAQCLPPTFPCGLRLELVATFAAWSISPPCECSHRSLGYGIVKLAWLCLPLTACAAHVARGTDSPGVHDRCQSFSLAHSRTRSDFPPYSLTSTRS